MKILLFICILWVYMNFDPSDGAAFTKKLGNCPKNGYKTATFHCKKKCIIKSAVVRFKKGGNIDIVGREGRRLFTPLRCGRKCFCRGFTPRAKFERCFKKRGHKIRTGIVSFVMKCRKFTRNVRFSVYGNIRPRKKTPKARKLGEIGDMAKDERKFFMFSCNDKCDLKSLSASYIPGGLVYLHGSETNHIKPIVECQNSQCLCLGKDNASDTVQMCEIKSKPFRRVIYLMVEAKKATRDVKLHYNISNFLKITTFFPVKKIIKDLGNMAKNAEKFFMVRCKGTCYFGFLYAVHRSGGLTLHASESSSLKDITSCLDHKCICATKKVPPGGGSSRCDRRNSATGNTFHIMVKAITATNNVKMELGIGLSYLSVDPFTPRN